MPIYETNVGKHNEDLCNSCFRMQDKPVMTDSQLSHKIADLADRIHYGQTYPLESLNELIELGEAAKKFKEEK